MGWNCFFIPKLQRCNRWSLGMDKSFPAILYWAYDYLSVLVLKLTHVSKRGPRMSVKDVDKIERYLSATKHKHVQYIQPHKCHIAPVPYPTIPHSEQKFAYLCPEWSIMGYGTGALWDLVIGLHWTLIYINVYLLLNIKCFGKLTKLRRRALCLQNIKL